MHQVIKEISQWSIKSDIQLSHSIGLYCYWFVSYFHQVQRKHVYDLRQLILTGDNESCSQHVFQWVPFWLSTYFVTWTAICIFHAWELCGCFCIAIISFIRYTFVLHTVRMKTIQGVKTSCCGCYPLKF